MSSPQAVHVRPSHWRDLLHQADLDRSISELIERVVVATRLSRIEKQQVVSELIAHFQDGLERGVSPETLIREFGEPRLAATLIRRGKIRNRTMANKFWRAAAYGGLGILVAYVFMSWFFYRGRPQPSFDYVAQLNQGIADVPEDQRAWPVYRKVMREMQFIEGGGRFDEIYLRNPGSFDDQRLVEATDGEQWQRAIDKLAASSDLLRALRLGGQRPTLGLELKANPLDYSLEDQETLFPLGIPSDGLHQNLKKNLSPVAAELVEGSSLNLLLPHLMSLRNFARILTVDTRWAVATGDWERAVQNIEAMFGLTRQACEPGFFIGNLLGCAISEMTCDSVYEVMASGSEFLSDVQLERIQQAVQRDSHWDLINLETERSLGYDLIQRAFTDDGKGDGRMTAAGLEVWASCGQGNGGAEHPLSPTKSWLAWIASPSVLLWLPSRRDYQNQFDQFYSMIEKRFFKPYHLDRMDDIEATKDFRFQWFSFSMSSMAAQQVRSTVARTEMNRQSVAAALAIYRFQRKNHRWPNSVDELLPHFLPAIPTDPLNGQPLVYLATNDSFILYSFGIDGDDDGGRPYLVPQETSQPAGELSDQDLRPHHASEFHFKIAAETDGDWIAWPRK